MFDLISFKILTEIHEFVNEFVNEMIEELRIGNIKVLLETLEHQIKEQKLKINKPFDNFVKKHSLKYFPKIENFIKSTKIKLHSTFKKITLPEDDLLPARLKEDSDKLVEAIFDPTNLFLEKVKLNGTKWIDPSFNNIFKFIFR